MISIRQLTLGLATLYLALLFISVLVGRWFWFYPAEVERQQVRQQQQADNLQVAYQIQLESLQNRAFQFITRYDPSNLLAESSNINWNDKLDQLDIYSIILADQTLSQRNIYQRIDNNDVSEPDLNDWLNNLVASRVYFTSSAETDIVRIGNDSYNLIIHAVNDQVTNSKGWLIFLQRISASTLSFIDKMSAFKVKSIPLDHDSVASIKSFDEPLKDLAQTHQRCIYSKAGIASACVSFTHYEKTPSFLNNKLVIINLLMLLTPVGIYYLILYLFTHPIKTAITILKMSNNKGIVEPLIIDSPIKVKELIELKDIFNATVKIANDNREELERISTTDKLTNIPNRRAFDLLLEKTWNLICRQQRSVALCMVDIDFFKAYNDHYGHPQGDLVLHNVAQALSKCAKRADEIVARYGGEEFAILAYVDDEEQLKLFSHNLQNAVRMLAIPHEFSDKDKQVTISIGITWINKSGEWLTNYTKEEWLNSSDNALYEAKDKGRQQNIIKTISEEQQFDV